MSGETKSVASSSPVREKFEISGPVFLFELDLPLLVSLADTQKMITSPIFSFRSPDIVLLSMWQ